MNSFNPSAQAPHCNVIPFPRAARAAQPYETQSAFGVGDRVRFRLGEGRGTIWHIQPNFGAGRETLYHVTLNGPRAGTTVAVYARSIELDDGGPHAA